MSGVRAAIFGGSALIALVLMLRLTLQKRLPRRLFPALWCIAAARLLLPVALPSRLSVWNLLQNAPTGGGAAVIADALRPFPAMIPSAETVVQTGAARIPPLLLIWAIGAAALGLYFAAGYVFLTRTFRHAAVSQPPCAALAAQLRLARVPRIRVTKNRRAPLTFGALRPTVLLPDDLPAGTERYRLVLAHELAHVRRRDCLRKCLLTVCLCANWWNPLVWAMLVLANRDMELACDEAVLCALGTDCKKAYALTLLDMAQRTARPSPLCSGFSRGGTEARIRAILCPRRAPAWAGVCAFALFLALGGALTTQAVKPPVREPGPVPAPIAQPVEIPAAAPAAMAAVTEPDAEPSAPDPEPAPAYVFPLENADAAVTCAYGWRTHEQTGQRAFHDGVDFDAALGSNVLAVADGTVLSAEFEAAAGYILTLEHADGVRTQYAHLSEFCAAPGDAVRQGQIIAKTGDSGWSTAPHLHLAVQINGEPADPLQTLGTLSE